MMRSVLIATIVCSCVACGLLFAQAATTQSASAPAAATQPASAPAVAATVGGVEITSAEIDRLLAAGEPVPPTEAAAMRKRVCSDLIFQELIRAYAAAKKVTCTPEELKAEKDKISNQASAYAKQNNMSVNQVLAASGITESRIRDQVVTGKLVNEAVADAKANAMIKANPAYFDGTVLSASDLLVACEPFASTVDQKEALAKIEKIAADIKAGTITFEDAAKKCDGPAAKRGGKMAPFRFPEISPQIAQVAFAIKLGQVSGVVRDSEGFHLIKVTGRLDGLGEPTTPDPAMQLPDPQRIARNCLRANLETEIVAQALTTCPIVINK